MRGHAAGDRVLVVAPSWVGDAILSEPLVARIRAAGVDAPIDVIAPPWCGPVFARMRGIGRIIDSPAAHGQFALRDRRTLGIALRAKRYTHAYVLPNTWKSALVPFLLKGVADVPNAAELFQADRIHPAAVAQARMLDNVWPELRKLL